MPVVVIGLREYDEGKGRWNKWKNLSLTEAIIDIQT